MVDVSPPRVGGTGGGHVLKASLAFNSGNFSTMQSTFISSVNRMVSSESIAVPHGQD